MEGKEGIKYYCLKNVDWVKYLVDSGFIRLWVSRLLNGLWHCGLWTGRGKWALGLFKFGPGLILVINHKD